LLSVEQTGRAGGGVSVIFYAVLSLRSKVCRLGRGLALVLALVATGLSGGIAAAQAPSGTERAALQSRKDALFQQMLREPGSLDIAFAYAEVAAKLGDNEAAVSALERMLLFNPDLPRVQLELGALYFRMGSYEISRTYFDRALAANPPDEVRSRIATYLGEINRLSAPQRFSGFLFFGPQHQSNANLAPGSPLVQSPIGPLLLNNQFVKQADWNFFATSSVLYAYDLGTQDRDTIEVGGTGFANHYGVVNRLDLGLVEATAGPRFNFTEPVAGIRSVSLKPYAIANDVSLGGNQYFHSFGVGGEATALVWDDIRLKSVFEFRNKNFNDAPDRPLSRGLQGSDKVFSLFVSKPITTIPSSELALEFDFLKQDTRLAQYSNNTFAGALAYRIRYDDPTGSLRFPWETTFFVSSSWADYAAPDPCCNTSGNPLIFVPATRSDRRLRFGLTQNFQVGDNISIVVQVQRDIVSSNLSLYGYTGNSFLIGPQLRF
jgi:hypothetical protein